jgi:hypothetical protein
VNLGEAQKLSARVRIDKEAEHVVWRRHNGAIRQTRCAICHRQNGELHAAREPRTRTGRRHHRPLSRGGIECGSRVDRNVLRHFTENRQRDA